MTLGVGLALAALNNIIDTKAEKAKRELAIKPVIENRERFERRTAKGFDQKIDDNRSDFYDRTRLGVSYTYGPDIKGQAVYQYASDPYWTRTLNASTDNGDLVLGNVAKKVGDGWFIGGIQRIIVGNERLLGECCEWTNFGNSYDAIRYRGSKLDAFVGRLSLSSHASKNSRIAGADYDTAFGKTLLYFLHDRLNVSSVGQAYDVYTLDQSYKHNFKPFTLELEGATQLGQEGTTAIRSWLVDAKISKQFDKKFSAFIDAQSISGGKENGKSMDFYSPYGNNHAYDGVMDMQGGTNKRSLAFEGAYKFSPTVTSELMYQKIGLFDSRDAWYGKFFTPNTYGSTAFSDPTGRKGRDVGQELDFNTKWKFRKDTELSAGVSEFLAGKYIQAFVPSGKVANQMWFYTQVSFKFAG